MTALSDELPSDELIAAERPAFEAWCKSEGIDAELWIKGQPQCGYTNARTTDYWTSWIGRALLAAQPAVQQPAEDAGLLDRHGKIRGDLKASAYCVGNEYKPFHPSASHVRPEWRDGWNACFVAAIRAARAKE